MKKEKRLELFIVIIFAISIVWGGITNFAQAIINPKMTQTELLLHLPKSFILDFKH